jgi:hypothetical protein
MQIFSRSKEIYLTNHSPFFYDFLLYGKTNVFSGLDFEAPSILVREGLYPASAL